MSDENTPAGTSVPAQSPALPAASPPPAPPAAAVQQPVQTATTPAQQPAQSVPEVDPQWMATRLERAKSAERAALLKELGVDDPELAKAAIAAAKAAEDAKKTAEQRAAELSEKLKGTQTEAEKHAALIREHAGRMLMALTPEQQKIITDFAGDNPAEQLRAVHHFAPTWNKPEPSPPAAAPPPAPPANTSPPPNAPPGNAPGSPPDVRTVYLTQRQTNPFAAAAYGLSNPQVYENKS